MTVLDRPETKNQTLAEPQRIADNYVRAAHDQIDQEWLDAGMTREQLDEGEMVSYLWEYMERDTGKSFDEIMAALKSASSKQLRTLQEQFMPDWKPRWQRTGLYSRGGDFG